MSSLRSRLQRHQVSGHLGRSPSGPRDKSRPLSLFPGEEQELSTPAGNCYGRELTFLPDYRHGPEPLSKLLAFDGSGWELPAKDKRLREVNPAGSLFVDIETTGLGRGSGTWAFLIGAGWFEGDCFKLRQYFLRCLPEEKAMIHHFTQLSSAFESLVTFNGKSFDLPIIWNRQILTGAPTLTEPPFHVDLLHCSRRLYSGRLQSCSLQSLEESLLTLRRRGDIPGEKIPAVYFDYLRRGETARLKQVFQHNVVDILSMVALLAHIIKTATQTGIDHPADYLALGNLYRETGRVERAIACFKKAACTGGEIAAEARWRLSLVYKRQDRWEEAVSLWEKIITARPEFINPYLELAKFYEHRQRDLTTALEFTGAALALASRRKSQSGPLAVPALKHRRRRLERKLSRA